MSSRHQGLSEAWHSGNRTPENSDYRVPDSGWRHRSTEEGGGWNSSRGQHAGDTPPPNNGIEEADPFPRTHGGQRVSGRLDLPDPPRRDR
ncbi:hypothetical protein SAMN05421810_103239 [Amycolatopsis arida]|uniref:Uncharacterized protein n=1 Tax=Amycolatopsis arida TaxID=587909 RepID=A0A1I5SQU1_9PSEU|nr:hypothetical protein [Amycolatopsis arida]TDX96382.1 hypothetical protein CLV69_103519 [Amycolatopsis arida]SFP73130.1 hypothetical protein SAMN05421810_103239 [Amycolatopsis arida]